MAQSREYYFVIVGHNDQPLFEMEFPVVDSKKKREPDTRHLNQFIAHASLDIVDEQIITSPQMYFKIIDKFNEWFVSAFVTASRIRFVMLHSQKNDEGIRQFFQEIYEMYIKHSMNPFYVIDTPIKSNNFNEKAIFYGKKYLLS
uniref:Trafficking protein particle complex subunit 2 n=1 Tax=Syphacia muris TaxID=451379 RepID=A0A0N5AHU3_9BILA